MDISVVSGMTVQAATGAGLNGGVYTAFTATTSVTLDPSDPLLDRYDTVCATTAGLTVTAGVAGTASDGSLVQPDVSDLVLAHVFVGAGVTSLTPDVIQDPRVFLDFTITSPSSPTGMGSGHLFYGNYLIT